MTACHKCPSGWVRDDTIHDVGTTWEGQRCIKCPLQQYTANTAGAHVCVHVPVSCEVSEWSGWSACSQTCGSGIQLRNRYTTILPKYGGINCPSLSESTECNSGCCRLDCAMTEWTGWSSCSKTCGSGERRRSRHVERAASCNGTLCGALEEVASCDTMPCPQDCEVGEWGGWGACSATCGELVQRRAQRNITRHAAFGGRRCPALVLEQSCPGVQGRACPIDCVVSEWGNFTACDAVCGGGLRRQTRAITTSPRHGGSECPATLMRAKKCNEQLCPVDCNSFFDPWSRCSKSCGTGIQVRHVSVAQMPMLGGRGCTLSESRLCNTFNCPAVPLPSPAPPQYSLPDEPSPSPSASVSVIPIINVFGYDLLTEQATKGRRYLDQGAVCYHQAHGYMSEVVIVSGPLFPHLAVPGVYHVSYNCISHAQTTNEDVPNEGIGEGSNDETLGRNVVSTDSAEDQTVSSEHTGETGFRVAAAATAHRTVVVVDTECPRCSVRNNHGGSAFIIEASFPYHDAGVICSDSLDGASPSSAVVTRNNVNIDATGTYTVSYSVRDIAGNWNYDEKCLNGREIYLRTVIVQDTLRPVITVHNKDYNRRRLSMEKNPPSNSMTVAFGQENLASQSGGFPSFSLGGALLMCLGTVLLLMVTQRYVATQQRLPSTTIKVGLDDV